MRKVIIATFIASVLACSAMPQGGAGGAAGAAGAAQGGAQGPMGGDRSGQRINAAIGTYLNAPEQRAILTPGEYTEWPLILKQGQVVVAEASSDAFDAALEIVDSKEVVLAENDDRFPGDQRPLLFWRAPADGSYALRCRSWRGKAGGQHTLRFNIYESMDLPDGEFAEKVLPHGRALLRVPMRAGQIKAMQYETPNQQFHYVDPMLVISPIGLPDIRLAEPLDDLTSGTVLLAPVDGDYYFLVNLGGSNDNKVRAGAFLLSPQTLNEPQGKTNQVLPGLWKISVKEHDLLEVSTPELRPQSKLVVATVPDISKYDLKSAENNPFFPQILKPGEEPERPAFRTLPARERDQRIAVLLAERDAEVWLATAGLGQPNSTYTMRVAPAAKSLPAGPAQSAQLRIGNTDYWVFDAAVGDVMTFAASTQGFAAEFRVRGPTLQSEVHLVAEPDQTRLVRTMVVGRPGRYLASMSSVGGGGGGQYTLERQVFGAKEFDKGSPASGSLDGEAVHAWKLNLRPGEPVLLRWTISNDQHGITIQDAQGRQVGFAWTNISERERYTILNPREAASYLIVLVGQGQPVTYQMEVLDLPGRRSGG
jgi:hypothetical protein